METRARQRRNSDADSLLDELLTSDAASHVTSVRHVGTMTIPETGRPADCSTGTTAPSQQPPKTLSASRMKGYRGGSGYNGGHGKREAFHSMADLLYAAKTNFSNLKIFLNSILIRHDIGYKALHDFNVQLDLMCNNFGVDLVEANTCVGRRDLSRDGVKCNKRSLAWPPCL
ncbi:hypothetical protein J6590_045676 [Homalodisca vitripennis]|nr:hypothetical protein J6590_045676 [Homalodisca vitripennis]